MTNRVKPSRNGKDAIAQLAHVVSRLEYAVTHGLQYGEDRDLYAVGGYPRTLSWVQFNSLYQRDGIAGQIVDMPAEATWRSPPEISEPDQEEGTRFTREFEKLRDRLGLWGVFERADRMARIGRYSVILMGIRGDTDATMPSPMRRLSGPEDLLYLAPFDEKRATINEWVADGSERHGQPKNYKIDLTGGIKEFTGTSVGTVIVDWTRVIHVAEGLLGDLVFGRPALLRVYNDLHDYQKVATSTGEAYWQRVAGILAARWPEGMIADDDQLKALDEGLKEAYHDLRRTLISNAEIYRVAETEPNPEPAANLYMTRIAAGAGIPKRMLFGSETGERASSEDQKTFLGSISERQKQHAEPHILRPFLDRLIRVNGLPKPGAEGYDVVWPTLFQVPEKEIAEANKLRADAIAALTPMGGDPSVLYEIDAERNIWPIERKADEPSKFDMQPMEPNLDPSAPDQTSPQGGQ